jgi:hypothetical protein
VPSARSLARPRRHRRAAHLLIREGTASLVQNAADVNALQRPVRPGHATAGRYPALDSLVALRADWDDNLDLSPSHRALLHAMRDTEVQAALTGNAAAIAEMF